MQRTFETDKAAVSKHNKSQHDCVRWAVFEHLSLWRAGDITESKGKMFP